MREFSLSGTNDRCAVIFLCGLSNKDMIYRFVIRPLQCEDIPKQAPIMQTLIDQFLSVGEVSIAKTFPDVMNALLAGDTIVLLDSISSAIIVNFREWEKRSLDSPSTETIIRGPNLGFIEDVNVNKMLIRRHIRDPQLRFHSYIMGKRSQKEVILVYIEDIINPYIVKELNRRLQSIETDIIFETGTIEQFLLFLKPIYLVIHLFSFCLFFIYSLLFMAFVDLGQDLFLPIVFIVIILLSLLNVNVMEFENLSPFFQTKMSKYMGGIRETAFTFIGFEVGFFYAAILKSTKSAPYGICTILMATLLYTAYFIHKKIQEYGAQPWQKQMQQKKKPE